MSVGGACSKCGAPWFYDVQGGGGWGGICPPPVRPSCACWNVPPTSITVTGAPPVAWWRENEAALLEALRKSRPEAPEHLDPDMVDAATGQLLPGHVRETIRFMREMEHYRPPGGFMEHSTDGWKVTIQWTKPKGKR